MVVPVACEKNRFSVEIFSSGKFTGVDGVRLWKREQRFSLQRVLLCISLLIRRVGISEMPDA
jgi:hypothetical protein